MDTWATSSLTPQIAGGWCDDEDLFDRVFPMDLRPQAHDIIRTWLFTTVLRSHLEHGSLPWSDVAISGWVLDPDRKKMSKSKGNVLTPSGLLERYGSDGVRYWAGRARLGVDAAFDEGQMKVGRRLAVKLLNVSRFVLRFDPGEGVIAEPLDRSLLARLATLVDAATEAMGSFDHARALELAEQEFWSFTDDHVELAKNRAYGSRGPAGAASAAAALRLALSVFLRLFAPFLPFVTEEVWSGWRQGSVHRAPWPTSAELSPGGDPAILEAAARALGQIRAAKSARSLPMGTKVELVTVEAPPNLLALLEPAWEDVREAARAARLDRMPGGELRVLLALPEAQA
jgi:valyl-tRNA synthetase